MCIHTKLIFLFVILKYAEYQRNPHVKCMSLHLSLLKYYMLGREEEVLGEPGTEELRCTSLCTTTMHIELCACMFLLFVTMNCKC